MTDARRVNELLDLVDEATRHDLSDLAELKDNPAQAIVVGQRVLLKLIPFAEPLGRDGPSRRAVLVTLIEEAEQRAQNDRIRFALGAVRSGMDMGVDRILVAALQDTEMLSRSARGCGACILSLFQRHLRRHGAPAAAPAAAPASV
jgi:hypothetical protein